MTCIVFHNMMVAHRVNKGEQEGGDWYELRDENNQDDDQAPDQAMEAAERRHADLEMQAQLATAHYDGTAVINAEGSDDKDEDIAMENIRRDAVEQRWGTLYSDQEHFKLREAIIKQLEMNAHFRRDGASDDATND